MNCNVKGCACEAVDADGRCPRHGREHLRAAGARGRQAQRERQRETREAQAAALLLETADDVRAAVGSILRAAYADGDYATALRAVLALETLRAATTLVAQGGVIRLVWPEAPEGAA